VEADVPFLFKQWGEWSPEIIQGLSMANRPQTYQNRHEFYHVGKKLAGRKLDGREWNQYPEVK
jgi:protein gp37